MVSVRKRIAVFTEYLSQDQYLPQRKMLGLLLPALLGTRSPVLMEIGTKCMVPAGGWHGLSKIETKRAKDTHEHYLSRHLANPRLDMLALLDRHFELIGPPLLEKQGKGVNFVVDGTDYQKAWARPKRPRGMKGATRVRDGSASTRETATIGMGYPAITIEASLPNGVQMPILHWLYSREDADPITGERYLGDEQVLHAVLKRVAPLVGEKSFVCFDEGYAGHGSLLAFDALKLPWVVRVPSTGGSGRRWIQDDTGMEWHLDEMVCRMDLPFSRRRVVGRGKETLDIRLGVAKVYLKEESSRPSAPWQTRARTLVVVEVNGAAKRMALLVHDWLGDTEEVVELIRSEYRRRWRVEESHRLNKSDWGFKAENFRVLTLRAIQRLVLLCMLISTFVAHFRDKEPDRARTLAGRSFAAGDVPRDPRYRLNQVIGDILKRWLRATIGRRAPGRRRGPDPPPDPLKIVDRVKNAWRRLKRLQREALAAGVELPAMR